MVITQRILVVHNALLEVLLKSGDFLDVCEVNNDTADKWMTPT